MNEVAVHKMPAETKEIGLLLLLDSAEDESELLLGDDDEGSDDSSSAPGSSRTQHVSATFSRSNGQRVGGTLKTVFVIAKGDPEFCRLAQVVSPKSNTSKRGSSALLSSRMRG